MKSDKTADRILKLTELLDYLVYRANMDQVMLSTEVQLLRNYIELEKLRYGDRLRIETSIVVKNESAMVAPLILLPFAENCFKHGGAGADGIFRIIIELHADETTLNFHITNSRKLNQEKPVVSGGVGLENIRQRLHLLYPGKHLLTIKDTADHFSVRLEIHYRDGNL